MELTIKYKNGTEEQVELEDTPLKEGEQIFKVGNKWYLKKMENVTLQANEGGILRGNMTREEEFAEVKKLIKEFAKEMCCGMFFTRNLAGDEMDTIFNGVFFTLDICPDYQYFELFGANEIEQNEILEVYEANNGRE